MSLRRRDERVEVVVAPARRTRCWRVARGGEGERERRCTTHDIVQGESHACVAVHAYERDCTHCSEKRTVRRRTEQHRAMECLRPVVVHRTQLDEVTKRPCYPDSAGSEQISNQKRGWFWSLGLVQFSLCTQKADFVRFLFF